MPTPKRPPTTPDYKTLVAELGGAIAEWSYLFPEKFDDNQHEAQSRKHLKKAERIYKQALRALDTQRIEAHTDKPFVDLARTIVTRWGEVYENEHEQISGCDAVDSLGSYVTMAKDALNQLSRKRKKE